MSYDDDMFLEDLKILIGNGIDEYWWTLDGNFELVNRLRAKLNMTQLTKEYREIIRQKFTFE